MENKSIELITKLVSFDTTSRNSNLKLIEFISKYLNNYNVKSEVIYNSDHSKANLHAVIGPVNKSGIILSGHTDVVPIDGQNWNSDPFTVSNKDNCLFGRGTADMKSFIGVVLSMVPKMIETNINIPIHLAFSYDEEVGCLGVPELIKTISECYPTPFAAIVGEPTEMNVVNSHKGVYAYKTTVSGAEGHSSAPENGVNSIIFATKLINFLQEILNDLKTKSTNPNFDPPYTSIHVGLINGGTALNIIPKECTFYWEYRLIPGESDVSIINQFNDYTNNIVLPEMLKNSNECRIETIRISNIPPLLPDTGSSAENLIMSLVKSNTVSTVAYGTEAGMFQSAEIPTIVCGPGNIAQAHKANEFIKIEQIQACEKFINKLIKFAKESD